MDDLSVNIIKLLNGSDINFKSICTRVITKKENGITHLKDEFGEVVKYGRTELSNNPEITCLIMFTLFDTFLEKKYSITPGINFKEKYKKLSVATNINIIEKECYRLIRLMRNMYVHGIMSVAHGNVYNFNHSQKNKLFRIDITPEKIQLLYSIIILLVNDKNCLKTKGHYDSIVATYYSELKKYVDNSGNFSDDFSTSLLSILSFTKLKTSVRYLYENADYTENKDKINILSSHTLEMESYSIDFSIEYKGEKYLIPKEILDINNSLLISDSEKWKVIS